MASKREGKFRKETKYEHKRSDGLDRRSERRMNGLFGRMVKKTASVALVVASTGAMGADLPPSSTRSGARAIIRNDEIKEMCVITVGPMPTPFIPCAVWLIRPGLWPTPGVYKGDYPWW